MRRTIQRSLLNHFGINKMGFFWSQTCETRKNDIIGAVEDNQMLAICGPIGAGKSILFRSALEAMQGKVKFVFVRNFYKENLTIGSIINAALADVDESISPRRDLEARSRQFIRVMGDCVVNQKMKICVVIEEAHRLHPNTLRAIKELRESDFAGISPLISVILIGHPLLYEKLHSRKEAFWRSQTMKLEEEAGWMDYDERINYLKQVFGSAIDAEASMAIASYCRKPLEIDYFVEEKMIEARKAGKNIIDGEVAKPSVNELYYAVKDAIYDGISYKKIADTISEAGETIGKTTVHDVLAAGDKHPKADLIRQAILKINKDHKIRKSA